MITRREFVSAAIAAGGAICTASEAAGATAVAQARTVEYYELRRYQLRRGQQQRVGDYLRLAAIPAITRAGAGPVGVFSVMIGPESPSMYVVMTHRTLDAFVSLPDRLAADAAYRESAASFLAAPATDPAYARIEMSLLRSFTGFPTLALPFGGENPKRPRIFELRTYESHSERAAKTKIQMFNESEIAIFRKAGLQPVFFGETLAGPKMPNLTYLLVYEDMAAHDKQWSAFSSDPDWRKLSTTPGYTDPEIVSNITNVFLRPADYSQI